MSEVPPSRWPAAGTLVAGLLLLAAGLPGPVAAVVGGLLAQPLLALGVRGLRSGWSRTGALRDVGALLTLWGAAFALAMLLLAWPLSALRDGGALGGQWRVLGERDASSWRGLAAALCIAGVLAPMVVLAWPGLVEAGMRRLLVLVAVVSAPLWHLLLQRLRPAEALPLPVIEMPGAATTTDVVAHAADEPVGDPAAALHAAARAGRVDRALALIEAGADPLALPPAGERDQRSLPVLAAVLPDLRLLRELIARGVDLNAAQAGMTPLLAATRDSWHGRPEAVMTLLANGADARARDADGNTPLHHAARSSDASVAALLRDAGAEVDAINADGFTPLGMACSVGNWRLAKFLLERGARAEVEGAVSALLAAAGTDEDDPAGVQLLLKHRARVDALDREGRGALHVAAASGHADIVATLIDAGAGVQVRDAQQATPLLVSAQAGQPAVFDALVAAGADPLARDAAGRTALHLAAKAEWPSLALVQRILELGVDPAATDQSGKRAAELAAEAGRWRLVAVLDPDYRLPACVGTDDGDGVVQERAPLDLLREGLREGRHDGLERLAALLSPAELGGLLHDPEAPVSAERVGWLLDHGAEVAVDAGDASPVLAFLALGAEGVPVLEVLMARAIPLAGTGGLARFLAGCRDGDRAGRGLEQVALALLEHGADPDGASAQGDPALSLSIHLGWQRLLERLLERGVALDRRDARGMTPLHLAAALGREQALKALVMQGASPELRAADGQTPLGVALSSGRRDLADWLDWRGWALPGRALQPGDVPEAAIAGDAAAVRRLLELGLPVDAVDMQGCTGLLRACGGGHREVVELLLERGADPQHVAHTGATPLSAAVSMRHGEIVDRLLSAGAGLEQRLPNDVTVLMLAAALGLPELCARLLTAGANVQATDAQGLTPLHCAALYGFTSRDRARLLALFDTLLLAGAEVDEPAAGGVTPLLLLLGARAEPGTACDEDVVLAALEHLLDEGVALGAADPRGFAPLHLAALHGLLRTTQRLLRAGADPDQRDALNRTAREIAVMRGFVDVAAEYVPVPQSVSMARFLRDSGR